MKYHDAARDEPDEHLRFAVYLRELEQVAVADEMTLISAILSDPDRTMVRSAVLRHLDRRADDLHLGPAYEPWLESMAQATACPRTPRFHHQHRLFCEGVGVGRRLLRAPRFALCRCVSSRRHRGR